MDMITSFIGFRDTHVSISTTDSGISRYVHETFEHMMAPETRRAVASIRVDAIEGGYSLIDETREDYPGTPFEHFVPLIKDRVRLRFMRAHSNLLWMHAAAVAKNGRALILAAPSGQGKSSLSTLLTDVGWQLLSDDIAPVQLENDLVLPYPQRPQRRLNSVYVPVDDVGLLEREGVRIPLERVETRPCEIAGVVIVKFEYSSDAAVSRLQAGSGALELLRNLTNFVDHKSAAVTRMAELARTVPIYSLTYGSRQNAVAILNIII